MSLEHNARKYINNLIQLEQSELKKIESLLQNEKPAITNKKYLRLLSNASEKVELISKYKTMLNKFSRSTYFKNAIVNASSQVKLVSTKIGATLWVDASNYLELVGKTIGDIVLMQNSTFKIAGIY